MGTGGYLPGGDWGVKRLGREADRSPPSSAQVKNVGPVGPITAHHYLTAARCKIVHLIFSGILVCYISVQQNK
jgi:hypothetical protein